MGRKLHISVSEINTESMCFVRHQITFGIAKHYNCFELKKDFIAFLVEHFSKGTMLIKSWSIRVHKLFS